jgi:hypothetical protein
MTGEALLLKIEEQIRAVGIDGRVIDANLEIQRGAIAPLTSLQSGNMPMAYVKVEPDIYTLNLKINLWSLAIGPPLAPAKRTSPPPFRSTILERAAPIEEDEV